MPGTARSFVVLPRGGSTIRGPVGGPLTIKANAENTGGTLFLFENTVGPKDGPPLHVHAREAEMWYILDGDFRFKADGEIFHAPAGSYVFIPRGTPHCFQNIGDSPARIMVLFAPAGMERFFDELARLQLSNVEPEVYRAIAHRSGMEVVGKPLAESDPL